MQTKNKFRYDDLLTLAVRLGVGCGLDEEKAMAMASKALDGDLLGYSTHGLMFFSAYLSRIEAGHIARAGHIEETHDHPGSFYWRCGRLPGAWAMERATTKILARLHTTAAVTVSLGDCSHIGCLQAYLLPFVQAGHMVTISATNPGVRSVAPFGGADPVLTSNPIAYGIPSRTKPLLIDFSTSLASNKFFSNYADRGETLPGKWLLTAEGVPTDDASVLAAKPPGTILPIGGLDFGYKGFGASLFVEAASLALSGFGRRRNPDTFGQSVFIHAINPEFFAGRDAFLDEVDLLIADCKASKPLPGSAGVRMPGERALALREEQLKTGVEISSEAVARLNPWLIKFDQKWPEAV